MFVTCRAKSIGHQCHGIAVHRLSDFVEYIGIKCTHLTLNAEIYVYRGY